MPILSAKFILDVSSPCLISLPDQSIPRISAKIDSFDVVATIISASDWKNKGKDDVHWTTSVSRLELLVSRDDSEIVSDIVVTPDGMRDLSARGTYMLRRLHAYSKVAKDSANRILRYFQYEMLTPSVRLFSDWEQALSTPVWLDANGNELRSGFSYVRLPPIPGTRGELGVRRLMVSDLDDLQAYFVAPTEAPLDLVLLSDAQTAWFDGSLRRTVLELAICAEIMVKRCFFAARSPAGSAFDYLEDKAKVSVRVLELIDQVALEAFGNSYKQHDRENYQHLDFLFRCRNKVAHRGELTYRDDSGLTVIVDGNVVEAWWHAVANLRTWIRSLSDQ